MRQLLLILVGLVVLEPEPSAATVYVVVSTYDGIVLAADSRVTLTNPENTRVLSDSGEKVKSVGSHVVVAFTGAAHLYDTEAELRNIGSIVDQYKSDKAISDAKYVDPLTVAKGLDSLLSDIYNRHQKANFDRGLLWLTICGYDTKGDRRIYELLYPKMQPSKVKGRQYDVVGVLDSTFASGVPTTFVRGQDDVWKRLILGYDSRLADFQWYRNVDSVITDSLDPAVRDTIKTQVKLNVKDFQYNVQCELMTLQDAIDFGVFVIRATIEAQRFNQSTIQGVGGPIDIAAITAEGFRWIQRKELHGEGVR